MLKKILILVLIFGFTQKSMAQNKIVVTDTFKYLKDSILSRSCTYQGKTLNYFLSNLKIDIGGEEILYFTDLEDKKSDSLHVEGIGFFFCKNSSAIAHILDPSTSHPYVQIFFQNPLAINRADFLNHKIWVGNTWNRDKEFILKDCVISKISVGD